MPNAKQMRRFNRIENVCKDFKSGVRSQTGNHMCAKRVCVPLHDIERASGLFARSEESNVDNLEDVWMIDAHAKVKLVVEALQLLTRDALPCQLFESKRLAILVHYFEYTT